MKTIFGPISSRRFGSSLGVDLSPSSKQCNFDCLYCELSPSVSVTKQKNVVNVKTIIDELKVKLNKNIDVITLTANGEPTLYPFLDKLIEEINKIKDQAKTLILTNSATLTDKKIFNSLLKLDQVKLSLDAVSSDIFNKIDRPYHNIDISVLIQNIIKFSQIFKGKLFIEILFVSGLNDNEKEIKKLNDVLSKIKCDRIDLGTIDRPPAYPVNGISYKKLHDISLMFDSALPIHIASRTHAQQNNSYYSNEEIINTLDKRPLTMDDINLLFDEDTKNRLILLINDGKIEKKVVENLEFLVPHGNIKRKKEKIENI